ncbi:MAG: hypothetical protein ACXABY_12910 [Candidatus Thorarchaeota archaeon]|jgi:hypothetical protein
MSDHFECKMCEEVYDKADRAVRLTDNGWVICFECIDFVALEAGLWGM